MALKVRTVATSSEKAGKGREGHKHVCAAMTHFSSGGVTGVGDTGSIGNAPPPDPDPVTCVCSHYGNILRCIHIHTT